MSRLRKLRRQPIQYFRDSQSPWARLVGAALARVMQGPYAAGNWMEPLPLPRVIKRASLARATRRRRSLIATHHTPLVSIVMAAHNASDTIAAAIASILEQSYRHLELIVVDDGSSDDTFAIATQIASADPRVRVLQTPKQSGVARARNTGLQATRGAFITFLDSDDQAHPQRIERQLAALLAKPSAIVCLCNGRRVDHHGAPVAVNGRVDMKWIISMMFPREPVLSRLGYFRPLRISEDSEYYERIKAVYGSQSEVRLFDTLLFARFSPDSLLFSDGDVKRSESNRVSHRRSQEAEHKLAHIAALLDRIRRNELDPYVAFDAED